MKNYLDERILYRAKVNYSRNRGSGVAWDELTESAKKAWCNLAEREIETGEGIWTAEDFSKLRESK